MGLGCPKLLHFSKRTPNYQQLRRKKQLGDLNGKQSSSAKLYFFYYSHILMNSIHCGQTRDTFSNSRKHVYQRMKERRLMIRAVTWK